MPDIPSSVGKTIKQPAGSISPDEDYAIRTVLGEAKGEGDLGWRSVAGVIRNRSQGSGESYKSVVLAPGQFEPWSSNRKKLESYDPNSPDYQQVANSVLPVLRGQAPDPTGGATHFYSPTAQAALGRTPPAWDDGTGTDIGHHRFFKRGYKGADLPDLPGDLGTNTLPDLPSNVGTTPSTGTLLKPGEALAPDLNAPAPQQAQTDQSALQQEFQGWAKGQNLDPAEQTTVDAFNTKKQADAHDEGYKKWLTQTKQKPSPGALAEFDKQQKANDDAFQQWAKDQKLDATQQPTIDAYNQHLSDITEAKVRTDSPEYATFLDSLGAKDSQDMREMFTKSMEASNATVNATNAGIVNAGNAAIAQQKANIKAYNAKVKAKNADARTAKEEVAVTDPDQIKALGGQQTAPGPQAISANDPDAKKKILSGGAGQTVVDVSQKPVGENLGRWMLQQALRQVAPQFGLTESDIDAHLEALKARGQQYSVWGDDWTDDQIQERLKAGDNPKIAYTLTNEAVNEMLARKKGFAHGTGSEIQPELEDKIRYENSLYVGAGYNPPDLSLRNPYLSNTGDPLLDMAYRNVMNDPFGSGDATEIKAEYERLKRITPSAEERANDVSLGTYIRDVLFSTARQAGVLNPVNASIIPDLTTGGTSGAIESVAGRGAEFMAGIYQYTMPGILDSVRRYLGADVPDNSEALAKFANRAKVVGASAKGDGIIADIGSVGGSLIGDVPRLIGLTILTGGNPIIAFGLDEALRASGRQERTGVLGAIDIGAAATQGAIMGAIFHGVGQIANWAGTAAARKLLTPEVVAALDGADSAAAFNEAVFQRAQQLRGLASYALNDEERATFHNALDTYLAKKGFSPEEMARYEKWRTARQMSGEKPEEFKAYLKDNDLTEDEIRNPFQYSNDTVTAKVASAKRQAVVTKNLVERGVSMGLVATAGFATAKLEGQSNAEAAKNAALWLVMDGLMLGMHKAGEPWSAEDIANADGHIIRLPDPDAEPPKPSAGQLPPGGGPRGELPPKGGKPPESPPVPGMQPGTKDVLLVADPDGRRLHAVDVTGLVTPDALDAQILPAPKPAVSVADFTPAIKGASASNILKEGPADYTPVEPGRTVSHPNPEIDGKPIVGETQDGKVVVRNEGNKGGISVVTDHSEKPVEGGVFEPPVQPESDFQGLTRAEKEAKIRESSEVTASTPVSVLTDQPKSITEDDIQKSIIGEKGAAKTPDASDRMHSLEIAKEMSAKKMSPTKVWFATGWEQGKDGKWRAEIDPNRIRMTDDGLPIDEGVVQLEDFVKAPELFAAYPQLKDLNVDIPTNYHDEYGQPKTAGGHFSAASNLIAVNGKLHFDAIESAIRHEIQHAIQNIEGFVSGTNPRHEKLGAALEAQTERKQLHRRINDLIQELGLPRDPNNLAHGYQDAWVFPDFDTVGLNPAALGKWLKEWHDMGSPRGLDDKMPDWQGNWVIKTDATSGGKESLDKFYTRSDAVHTAKSWAQKAPTTVADLGLTDPRAVELKRLLKQYHKGAPSDKILTRRGQERYMRNAGEVEARNAETRANLSEEQRRHNPPSETEDVPRKKQIVLEGASGIAESASSAKPSSNQTQTPDFKQWFGDSKVVDPDGKPLKVFHGTDAPADFSAFRSHGDSWGIHFGDEPTAALNRILDRADEEDRGALIPKARTIPAYLRIENPLRVSDAEATQARGVAQTLRRQGIEVAIPDMHDYSAETRSAVLQALERAGYDGLEYANEVEGGTGYVVFHSNQIKSAIGNRGTFDPNEDDIMKMVAWHGSPHVFDKFDLSKVGTGEGAQAYGYGLYFATSEDVADWYRDKLVRDNGEPTINGETYDAFIQKHTSPLDGYAQAAMRQVLDHLLPTRTVDDTNRSQLVEAHEQFGTSITQGLNIWKKKLEELKNATVDDPSVEGVRISWNPIAKKFELMERTYGQLSPDQYDTKEAAHAARVEHAEVALEQRIRTNERMLDALAMFNPYTIQIAFPRGTKYQVDLKPSEQEYLDLDTPLDQQSEVVKKAVEEALRGVPRKTAREVLGEPKIIPASDTRAVEAVTGMSPSDFGEGDGGPLAEILQYKDAGFIEKYADGRYGCTVMNDSIFTKDLAEAEHFLWSTFGNEMDLPDLPLPQTGKQFYTWLSNELDHPARAKWVAERDRLIQALGAGHPDTLEHLNKNPRSDRLASEWLLEKGVRGNRYLDGFSRNRSKNAHNYVIFNDQDVEIVDMLKSIKDGKAVAKRAASLLTDTPKKVAEDQKYAVSTRQPKGHNAKTETHIIGLDSMPPAVIEKATAMMARYPGMRLSKKPATAIEQAIEHMKQNLLWLHDVMPEDMRDQAMHWYDSGRQMALNFAVQYKVSRPQAAGVLATLSPQQDWFQNISQADRVLDTLHSHGDAVVDKSILALARLNIAKYEEQTRRGSTSAPFALGSARKALQQLRTVKGKTLDEMSPIEAAVLIRAFDETYNDPSYASYAPTGERTGLVLTAKGLPARVAWKAYGSIAKAVSIARDGSRYNISTNLGQAHKVRNFYNNILVPNDPAGHVTIDTHAVAADLVRPLAGSDPEVMHVLGNTPGSLATGSRGLYGVHAEAYRRAAAERGLLPRQMQSITWEGVRGLFSPEFKRLKGAKKEIANVWSKGRDRQEILRTIYDRAGGIETPDWYSPDPRSADPAQRSADARQLPPARRLSQSASGAGAGSGVAGDVPEDDIQKSVASDNGPALQKWLGNSVVRTPVYHGTGADIARFADTSPGYRMAEGRPYKVETRVKFFADDPAVASEFADTASQPLFSRPAGQGNVMPVHIKIEHPLDLSKGWAPEAREALVRAGVPSHVLRGMRPEDIQGAIDFEDVLQPLEEQGYDGAIFPDETGRGLTYAVFDSSHIKSVFNDGTYGPTDDIMKSNLSPLGFYSQAERTIAAKMPNKASAEQVRAIFNDPSIKQEERDWLDIDSFLKDNPKPTKEQVLDFIRMNNADVREVIKGDGAASPDLSQVEAWWDDEGGANMGMNLDASWEELNPRSWSSLTPEERIRAQNRYRDEVASYAENATEYDSYTTPGGENYREVLLTLPLGRDRVLGKRVSIEPVEGGFQIFTDRRPWGIRPQTFATEEEARDFALKDTLLSHPTGDYTSPHWSEPNVLAHIRFDDRDGGKTLHIHEIQSDWHQQGRKKGYQTTAPKGNEFNQYRDSLIRKYGQGFNPDDLQGSEREHFWQLADKYKASEDDIYRIGEGESPATITPHDPRVPDAPFKKSWHELAFKRMIRYAVENGYDRITWDTGETNADRYDLSHRIDKIAYRPDGDGTFEVSAIKNGDSVLTESYKTPQELEDIVGKDIAQKIVNGEGRLAEGFRGTSGGVKEFSGIDLKVGGEGMVGFYDKMLPAFVNKYTKKWGGRVTDGRITRGRTWNETFTPLNKTEARQALQRGETVYGVRGNTATGQAGGYRIETEADLNRFRRFSVRGIDKVHALDITPAMKASVGEEGQSLFSRAESRKEVHTGDVLTQMTGGTLHASGELQGNDWDLEMLRRVIEAYRRANPGSESGFDGLTISNATLARVVQFYHDTLRPTMVRNNWGDDHLAPLDQFMQHAQSLIDMHPTHGIVWSNLEARTEEVIHRKERELGGVSEGTQTQLEQHPLMQNPGLLFRTQYGNNSPRNQVSEIAAKLIRGQEGEYGWDRRPDFQSEKESFLQTWANGLVDNARPLIEQMGYDAFVNQYGDLIRHADNLTPSDSGRSQGPQGDQGVQQTAPEGRPGEGPASPAENASDQARQDEGPPQAGTPINGRRPDAGNAAADRGTSRAGRRLEAESVAEQLTTAFGDTAGYDKISVEDQVQRAMDLVANDPATAISIMNGTMRPPEGLNPMSVFVALKEHAKATGDADLIAALARSPLTSESSYHAQSLRMLREAYPNDPVKLVQDVQKTYDRTKPVKGTSILPADAKAELQRLESEYEQKIADLERETESRAATMAEAKAKEELDRILGEPRPSSYVLALARQTVQRIDSDASKAREALKGLLGEMQKSIIGPSPKVFEGEDAYHEYNDKLHEAFAEVIGDYRNAGSGERVEFPVVSKDMLAKVWNQFIDDGHVTDIATLNYIQKRILLCTARLDALNALAGHDTYDPNEEYDLGLTAKEQDEMFNHWATDSKGQWTISDYGLPKIQNLLFPLLQEPSPEKKVVLIDKILNIIHQRGDLAEMFVQGGSDTVQALADGTLKPSDDIQKSVTEPSAKSALKDVRLPSRNEVEGILREHPLVGLRERVKNIYVVGSYAKGNTHPESDLDVLLEVTPKKGYTAKELEDKYRRKLQQYFVTHDIWGKDDSVHPQWNGHRVDIYFTYDASTESRPKVLLSQNGSTPTQVTHYESEGDRPLDLMRSAISDDSNIMENLAKVGASHIARIGTDPMEFRDAMKSEFPMLDDADVDKVYDRSKALVDNITKSPKMTRALADTAPKKTVLERIQAAKKRNADADLSSLVQQLARAHVERGIKNRDDLVDAVHRDLQTVDPNTTRREAMDMISGYGKYRQLSQDQIAAELSDLKAQLQQIAKLDDMAHGQPPKKTGFERREPSDETRRLIQRVEADKKRIGYDVTAPATQLKTALATAKTRLRNQIKDLEHQIQTRAKIVKTKTRLQYDPEALRLQSQRDELRKQYREVFGEPTRTPMTDEQRLRAWKTRAERRQKELEEKLRNGDYAPTPKRPSVELDAPAKKAKSELDALNARIASLRDLAGLVPQEVVEKITELSAAVDRARAKLIDADGNPINRRPEGSNASYKNATKEEMEYGQAERDLQTYVESVKLQHHDPAALARIGRMLRKPLDLAMTIKTFGHGGVIPFTHARNSLFIPGEQMMFLRAVNRAYSYAPHFRSQAAIDKWNRDMSAMRSHPTYDMWAKAGLDIKAGSHPMGMGRAAWTSWSFDALKPMRLELANHYWQSYDEADRTPELQKIIVDSVNHMSGVIHLPRGVMKYAAPVMFSPKLKPSKYAAAFVDPAKSGFALGRMAKMIAMHLGLLVINDLINRYLAHQTGDDNVNWADPTRADWLRGKVAGMTIPLGPVFELMRLPIRAGAELIYNAPDKRFKAIKGEIAGAIHPGVGLAYSGITGEDLATGNKLPFKGLKQYITGKDDRHVVFPQNLGEFAAGQGPMLVEPLLKDLAAHGVHMDKDLALPLVEDFLSAGMGEHIYEQHTPKKKSK